jgi:GA4 desaturase
MPIVDIRPLLFVPSLAITLHTHGFTIVKHSSALLSPSYTRDSWNDQALREETHYPDIEQVVKEQTGARKVFILGGTARTRRFREPEGRPTPPPVPEGTVVLNTNAESYPAFKADYPRVQGLTKGRSRARRRIPIFISGSMGRGLR